jgi:hypothetical protein
MAQGGKKGKMRECGVHTVRIAWDWMERRHEVDGETDGSDFP